jgi:hypothetical protein
VRRSRFLTLLYMLVGIILLACIVHSSHIPKTVKETATGWMAGVQFPAGVMMGCFLLGTVFTLALGPTHPPIQWVPVALTPGVNRPGREADLSPSSSAKVKSA